LIISQISGKLKAPNVTAVPGASKKLAYSIMADEDHGDRPPYGSFFGAMGATAAMIFSGKYESYTEV
jgi:hypothetical protein